MSWTPEEAKQALKLREEGLTFKEIAESMGGDLSKGQVQARIYRLTGRTKQYVRPKANRPVKSNPNGSWDEKLIEPWVEFAARRRTERMALRV